MSRYLCIILLLAGCATEEKAVKSNSPDEIYSDAYKLFRDNEYTDAAEKFKEIEAFFPYSMKANDGQVMSAYSYFMASDFKSAIREIEVFLRYHPADSSVPFMMYLKAICMYMQVSDVGRDSSNALEAKMAFVELLNRFPNSKYQKDSLKRIILLDGIVAAHEMMIGRFYQKNANAVAAIKRYNFVVAKFPRTKQAEEAYFRIVECCNALGLHDESSSTYNVMKTTYPDSVWTKKAEGIIKK